MSITDVITAITILGGAGVLLLASRHLNLLLKLLVGTRDYSQWRVARWLVWFFMFGYLASVLVVLFQRHDRLHAIVGIVYLFGALFVLLMTNLSQGAITDLLDTTVSRVEMENTLAAIPDALFVATPEGRIRRVNQNAVRFTGWPASYLANKPITVVLPEMVGFEPHCDTLEYGFDSWLRARGGKSLPVALSISVLVDDDGQVLSYVCLAKDITIQKLDQERLAHEASHDALTGLPNRAALVNRLEKELRRGRGMGPGMLFIDLDHFKPINDCYGHQFGDRLLVLVARRLEGCVRSGDLVARYGGDEFVILLCGTAGAAEVEQAAKRVLDGLAAPFTVDGQPVTLTASIGCLACGGQADDADRALRDADMALYQAKADGRARAAFFVSTQARVAVY